LNPTTGRPLGAARLVVDAAVQAIRAGAWDFLAKPIALDALAIAVARAIEHLSLRREVRRLRAAGLGALEGVVGESGDPQDDRAHRASRAE
jgi:DNA-binding NtrC family response regulator